MNVPYPLPTTKPYTAEQVRQLFVAAGEAISTWAESNGYTRHEVYCVLGGQRKATRGRCHEIALKLGMKLPVSALAA